MGLVDTLERYLDGTIKGDDLVSTVDEFVSSDRVYDLPDDEQALVHALQDQLALYVSDPGKRAEFAGYLSDADVKNIVRKFILDVRAVEQS